jgi:phospho-N-acetylmuramoyl-pentapeptide-transferase
MDCFIPIVIFIVTAVSNGANITDGIDGLAAGTSTVIFYAWLFAYLSGNIIFADYLNIMFLPIWEKPPFLPSQW